MSFINGCMVVSNLVISLVPYLESSWFYYKLLLKTPNPMLHLSKNTYDHSENNEFWTVALNFLLLHAFFFVLFFSCKKCNILWANNISVFGTVVDDIAKSLSEALFSWLTLAFLLCCCTVMHFLYSISGLLTFSIFCVIFL